MLTSSGREQLLVNHITLVYEYIAAFAMREEGFCTKHSTCVYRFMHGGDTH